MVVKDQKLQRDGRHCPNDLIIGVVASILLHGILFFGGNHWNRFVVPDLKRERDEPVAIEFVEVPPSEATPPPETSRRAATDSVAGGEAKPERPVSAARSVSPTAPSTSYGIPTGSPTPQPAPSSPPQPKTKEPAASEPDLPAPLPQSKPQVSPPPQPKQPPSSEPDLPAPLPQSKPQVSPPPQPKQPASSSPDLPIALPQPKPQVSPPPQPKQPASSSPDLPTALPQPKPQVTARAPANPEPKPLTRQENSDLVSPEPTQPQVETRVSPQTPSGTQPSQTSGAASSLGGPISLSIRDFGGNYQAALPNSNRSNPGASGIDARRDVVMGSYFQQLQQKVNQQFQQQVNLQLSQILTQSSRRTVVHFVVNSLGQVSNLQIIQSSGSSVIDKAALSAIERSAPFAPLPRSYPSDTVNIQYTLTLNIF